MENGFLLPNQSQDLYFHHVTPGDTLSGIINSYYPDQANRMQDKIKQVLIDNPSIKNPDVIKPGQLVVLRTASSTMCLAPIDLNETNKVKHLWSVMSPQTQKAIKETAPIYNGLSLGLAGGGTALFTLEKTLKSNMALLNGIPDAYHQYKSGTITKYQFDKIRTAKLNLYTKNIGPIINKGIYGDAKVKNAFKLPPGRSLNSTKSMTQHLNKLSKISNAVSKGGVVLAGVGLASSCYQVSQAETLPEKNEIAVKAISSTIAGAAIGVVATVFLVSTPVGWGIILVAGAVSAVGSWGAGELAGSVYKSNFSDTDIVNSLGITSVCN
ncbi:MAG: LysM domain-containing protein [Woeseiaceae bacterium]